MYILGWSITQISHWCRRDKNIDYMALKSYLTFLNNDHISDQILLPLSSSKLVPASMSSCLSISWRLVNNNLIDVINGLRLGASKMTIDNLYLEISMTLCLTPFVVQKSSILLLTPILVSTLLPPNPETDAWLCMPSTRSCIPPFFWCVLSMIFLCRVLLLHSWMTCRGVFVHPEWWLMVVFWMMLNSDPLSFAWKLEGSIQGHLVMYFMHAWCSLRQVAWPRITMVLGKASCLF